MAVCSRGHEVEEDQRFCDECGEPLGDTPPPYMQGGGEPLGDTPPPYMQGRPPSTARVLSADALWLFSALAAIACAVMFVFALVGAGEVNTKDQFDTSAYLGLGSGAVADRRRRTDRDGRLASVCPHRPLARRTGRAVALA